MTILFFLAAIVITANACTTSLDCQLLGDCVEGACQCDRGWQGETCSMLKQGASTVVWPTASDRAQHTSASWGASILVDAHGATHLFTDTTCLADTCAHTNSAQIVHSKASSIEGPYDFIDVAIPAEIENVHAAWAPDGTALLYYGDHDFVFPNKTCTGGGGDDDGDPISEEVSSSTTGMSQSSLSSTVDNPPYPRHVKRMGIAYTDNVDSGPWQQHFPEYDASLTPFLPLINPSPMVLMNGTVVLAFRYSNGAPSPMPSQAPPPSTLSETNGIAIADSWKGPYRLVTAHATPNNVCEDPYIFQNTRGYHLVYHCYRGVDTGCHSFSRSLAGPWTVSPDPVYNTTLTFTNGTQHTFQYRERPEMVFDSAVPTHLFTGVEWGKKNADYGGCASYSVLSEILP